MTAGEYPTTGQPIFIMDAISAQQIANAPTAAAPFMHLMKISSRDIGICCSLTSDTELVLAGRVAAGWRAD